MPEKKPDPFKHALRQTIRSLTQNAELDVFLGGCHPKISKQHASIPYPLGQSDAKEKNLARGYADNLALYWLHHDPILADKISPNNKEERAVFDALESMRYELVGAKNMPGITHNLQIMHEEIYKQKIKQQDQNLLSEAICFIIREKMTGQKPSPDIQEMLHSWREQLEPLCDIHIHAMMNVLNHQEDFAKHIHQLLLALRLCDDTNPDSHRQDVEDHCEDDNDVLDMNPQPHQKAETLPKSEAIGSKNPEENQSSIGEGESTTDQEGEEIGGALHVRKHHYHKDNLSCNYDIFTPQFDEIIEAKNLCRPEELICLRRYLDKQLCQLQNVVTQFANRLQRRLQAKQMRAWEFDLEEGFLDVSRLTRVILNPCHSLSFKKEHETLFQDTIVTLLIDNSGSMRGRPITIAAMSVDILARTLERCGVKTEILGFTTCHWKGGRSRKYWVDKKKPSNPGRLNDLRHIIYKSADMPWRRAKCNIGLMMREGLLKENIDGEALLWAYKRLLIRSERRRILLVISDGAPVDDSTLSVNRSDYLEQHLRHVIEFIEMKSSIELIAIGIGHDVTRYYQKAVTITDTEQLSGAIIDQLVALFEIYH